MRSLLCGVVSCPVGVGRSSQFGLCPRTEAVWGSIPSRQGQCMTTAASGDTPTRDAPWRTWHGYAPLDAPASARAAAAAGDVFEGLRRWRLWSYLAAESVKNQY